MFASCDSRIADWASSVFVAAAPSQCTRCAKHARVRHRRHENRSTQSFNLLGTEEREDFGDASEDIHARTARFGPKAEAAITTATNYSTEFDIVVAYSLDRVARGGQIKKFRENPDARIRVIMANVGDPTSRKILNRKFCYTDQELKNKFPLEASENFFESPPEASDMMHDKMRMDQPWVPVGIVRQASPLIIETRNVLQVSERVEYLGRNMKTLECSVIGISLEDGTRVERANPGNLVLLEVEPVIVDAETNSIFRKQIAA